MRVVFEGRCTKNDRAARDALLQSFDAERKQSSPDPIHLRCWHERQLHRLFEGVSRLDVAHAVSRSAIRFMQEYDPVFAGELLAWGSRHGIVAFGGQGDERRWSLIRPGVTFIPKNGGDLDVRCALASPRGLSIAALASREAKYRRRVDAALLKETKDLVQARCRMLAPEVALGDELRASDLPPVETMGGLAANLEAFFVGMPLYRVRELRILLGTYPQAEHVAPAEPLDIAPPELADLHL